MLSGYQTSPAPRSAPNLAAVLGEADSLLASEPVTALALCARVLEELPPGPDSDALGLQAQIQAADAALKLGRLDVALSHLAETAAYLPRAELLGRAHRIRAQIHLGAGEVEQAHQCLALAIRTAERVGQREVQADALNLRAQIEHRRGESVAALDTLGRVRDLRAQCGDVDGEIRAVCNHAMILIALGRGAEALAALHWALGRLQDSAVPLASELHVHSNLGLLLEGMERFEEAAGHFLRARDAALAAQDHAAHAAASLNAGEMVRRLGRAEAAELLTTAYLSARDLGLIQVKGAALHSLGLLHSSRGEHEEAERCLARAEALAQGSSDLDAQLEAMLGRAKNWLASEQRERAMPTLQRALTLAGEGERPQAALDAHMLLADALEADHPRASLEHLRRATALERELRAVALARQAQQLATDALLSSARLEAEHERQLRSISEQARAEAEATVQAQVEELERGRLYDSVTGLPNRLLLRVLIGQDIREELPFSLAVLDFDRFRGITEALGDAGSEELLRQVAARLEGLLDHGETLARLSNDVFALIVKGDRQPEAIRRRGAQLMAAFTAEFRVGDAEVVIAASVGIAHYPQHAQDADGLLLAAHLAAGEARDGSGVRVCSPQLPSAAGRSDTLSLESNLARALERDEFELHFQPLVDAVSGRAVTAEALLRWNSAALGRRSPAEFIPLLERSGLILPVGDWVLREACRQAATWDGVRVAVNLSARQFMGGDLAGSVTRALDESGLAPDRLELEITESLMMQSPERAVQLLTALKRTGVRVMLDDFGTGFSNLSYLHAFPLDGLKIDRSFVVALSQGERAGGVIAAIVGLGRTLGLEVVAEGIETAEQHRTLLALGVPILQGYLFGRPQANWRP